MTLLTIKLQSMKAELNSNKQKNFAKLTPRGESEI